MATEDGLDWRTAAGLRKPQQRKGETTTGATDKPKRVTDRRVVGPKSMVFSM